MAGSVRFEMSSASPEELAFAGSYPNGLRGNYPGASLDRSGSFREGSESRMFSSGGCTPRGSAYSTGNLPPLPQCLMLDPITMADQKCPSLGELRRVLGVSFGGTAEDNAFGTAHLKPHPPVATEELKWVKASVLDASNKARVRAKRLDESIDKLNRYCEALNLKKQQRNEFITNERSGGSNLPKMGAQMNRNSSDLMNQRLEDRTKTVVMNRRVRSSVTEIRAEGRSNMLTRQPVVMGKDRDMLRGEGSDVVEEKIRRLPAGGEAWDKKMKRKRSVGTVFSRPMDGDAELKRNLHHKPTDEPGPQASDAQGFRSGSFNGGNGINKLDSNSLSVNANARVVLKNELDKVSLSRDLMAGLSTERLGSKGNNKLNVREDSQIPSPTPVTKGKASRAPRNGPITASNSSPSFPRTSGTPEGWEQPATVNKNHSINGAINRKRPMPTGSASPPMAQWVGQRPQKISRTRRSNLVSPVSNHDELQIPSEGYSPSDAGARLNSFGTNGLLQKSVSNCAHQIRVKQEIVSSPARLSESEESGAGENRESRLKEKGPGGGEVDDRAVTAVQNTGSSLLPTKKNKLLNKEEIGVGVRRQGRSGRGSSISRASTVATREKLETPASTKPLKSMRPGSERNGSKSGRPPLKKLSDRKAFACPGHISTNGSPDFAGESGDDREELLAAAAFACTKTHNQQRMTRARRQTHEKVNANKATRGSGGLAQEMRSAQPQVQVSSEHSIDATVFELDGRLTLVQERLVNWKVKATDYGIEADFDAVNNVRNQLGPLHELEVPIVTNNDATSYRAAVNKRSNFLQEGRDDDISDYSFEQALAIIDQLPDLFHNNQWDENELDRARWAAKFDSAKNKRMETAWDSIAEADLKEIRKKTGSVKREVLLGKRFDHSAAGRIIYAGTDAFNALTGPAQMVAMERLVTLLAHTDSAGRPTLVGDIEVMLGYKALDTALAWFITDRDSPSGHTRFPETVEGDFSRNDREQRSRVAHICDAWFKKLGLPEWYRELMFQLEHYTLVNYEFGLRVNLHYQLATGTTNTTFRNSIYNATMFAVCCRRQHRKGKALVLGDDLLAALDRRLDLKAWVADVATFKMVLKAKAPRMEGEATFLSRRLFTQTDIPFMIPQPEKAYFRFNARANPNPAMSDDQYICAKALSYAFSFQHCHLLRDIFLKRFHMNGSHMNFDIESIGWNNRQFGFTVQDIYDRTMTSPNLIEFGDLSYWITELYKDIDACDFEELFESMICSNETAILDDPRAECFARFIG